MTRRGMWALLVAALSPLLPRLAAFSPGPPSVSAAELRIVQEEDYAQVAMFVDDQAVLVYNYGADLPKPSVHPLYTPAGHEMTQYAPEGHVHHRGWMFALGNVAFADAAPDEPYVVFWGEEGEPHQIGRILHTGFEALESNEQRALLVSNNDWRRASDQALMLTERRRIVLWPPSQASYLITWESELTAGGRDLIIGGTPGRDVSYYGLGLRVAADMDGGEISDANGKSGPEAVNGDDAEWCAYVSTTEPVRGFAMFDHPDNPRHPTGWFAMNEFGYITASIVAHEPYLLPAGETLGLRYGLFVFDGPAGAGPERAAHIAEQYELWKQYEP